MDSQERDKTILNARISEEEGKGDKISYFVFESVQVRNERTLRRLWITSIILAVLLFLSNMAWLWVFSGYDMETYEYEQGNSGINIIGDENKEVTYNGTTSENTEVYEKVRHTGQDNESKS